MTVSKAVFQREMKKRGNFTMVPNEIWDKSIAPVSSRAKLVWIHIASQAPTWPSSIKNIARNLGMKESTVSGCLDELKTAGMLDYSKNQRQATDFTVCAPSEWSTIGAASPDGAGVHSQSKQDGDLFGVGLVPNSGPIKDKEENYKNSKRKGRGYLQGDDLPSGREMQRSKYSQSLPNRANTEPWERAGFTCSEAHKKYEDFKARKFTPPNGVSLREYSEQRAYAELFPPLDIAAIERRTAELLSAELAESSAIVSPEDIDKE